eukprot:1600292-Alexandrium_andersonii.AAC.1
MLGARLWPTGATDRGARAVDGATPLGQDDEPRQARAPRCRSTGGRRWPSRARGGGPVRATAPANRHVALRRVDSDGGRSTA